MTEPLLIFQRLCTEWGREGRSAALTALRRDLPKAYPLPAVPNLGGVVALAQNVEWTDADAFAHARETVLTYGQLADLHSVNSPSPGIQATPVESGSWQLVPLPFTGLGGALRLRPGQLARFEWNERLGERCRHTVVSVALGGRTLDPRLFLKLPDFYLSHMVDLNERRWKARRVG